MAKFNFNNVGIVASSEEEAKSKLKASLNLMDAVCNVTGVHEYIRLCEKIKNNPDKIKMALKFL